MATGDEAAAAGLSVEPPTRDLRLGFEGINRRGDELARHMTSGTHPFERITGQVKTAQIEDLAVATPKLSDWAVTPEKLAPSAVTSDKIAPGAVTPNALDRRMSGGVAVATAGGTSAIVNTGLSGQVVLVASPRDLGDLTATLSTTVLPGGAFRVDASSPHGALAVWFNWIALEIS